MGNRNVTSKRTLGAELKSQKLKSVNRYGYTEPTLKYRGRSQTPSSAVSRKSKRKFVLEHKEWDEAKGKNDQSQSESEITFNKRSVQGREIDLETNAPSSTAQSRVTPSDTGSQAGRRNIFDHPKKASESQATISTASSLLNQTNEGIFTKKHLSALKIPVDIKQVDEDERRQIMSEIYLEEFRRPECGVFYYVEKKWLDKWILYMKDDAGKFPKPKEIRNTKIWKLFQNNIEIRPHEDAYCLNKRIWVMLQYVYGGGPEVKEGVETERSTNSSRSHGKKAEKKEVKQEQNELYKAHQLRNIPDFPQRYYLGKGVVGFFNNYLYCYLNACLQMLMTVTPLRNFLVNQEYLNCKQIARMSGRAQSQQPMCFAMAKTYYNVWTNKSSSQGYEPVLRTSEIQSQLRGTFSPMNENDCHEALLFILSRLQEEMTPRKRKYTLEGKSIAEAWNIYRFSNPSVIDELFCGLLRSTVTCGGCGYESITYDPFYDLSLPIKGIKGDIYTCIDRFLSEERFQKKMYDCEKCHKRNKATKKFDLVKLPKYLMVVFKRFSGITSKIKSSITFPTDLDLTKMLTKGHVSEFRKYSLVSMMEHLGSSARSGHYVGFFKRKQNWYEADDERIRAISARQLLREEAYVLLYEAI